MTAFATHPASRTPLDEDDAALDTVAALLRALARTSRGGVAREELDAWVGHLVLLAPPPGSYTPRAARDWAGVRQAAVAHIAREGETSRRELEALSDAIWSLVEGTARIVAENVALADRLADTTERLRATLSLPPEELRAAALAAVTTLTTIVDDRRAAPPLEPALAQRLSSATAFEQTRRLEGADPLTGLAGRRVLDRELGRAIMLRALSPDPLSLLAIDLDDFQAVNEIYGRTRGDEALQTTAQRLARAFPRAGDLVARVAGDEFAVLLRYASTHDATRLGERFLATLRESSVTDTDNAIAVTASIGCAAVMPGDSAADALRRADDALVEAKRAGGDRVALAA